MKLDQWSCLVLWICAAAVVDSATPHFPFFKVFTQTNPVYRGRADPIVNPGVISPHVHKVFGASGFSLGINRTAEQIFDDLQASTCTTASITIDKSAYWIPDLYYKWPNGSISLVPNGGLTVYYIGRGGNGAQTNPTFHPFPRGFRMLAGDPFKRNYTGTVPEQAISFACLATTGGPETHAFPTDTKFCKNGLRAQVFFPSCWNGIDVDSPNHKDHVAYPTSYNLGNCPATHPYRLQGVFYEVLFSVDDFPHGNGTNPFMFSSGDPTGYGLHGDFLNGWDVNILAQALVDPTCFDNNTNNGNNVAKCNTLAPYLKTSNPELSCVLDKPIPNYEDIGINHLLSHLPGCNPLSYGPGRAVPCFGSYAQEPVSNVLRVLIKSKRNGLYVSSRTPNQYLTADTQFSDLSYPNVFELTPLTPAGKYTILTEGTLRFVSANNRGSTPITGNRPGWSTWETWNITFIGGTGPTLNGTLASILSFSNDKYVQVLSNGQLIANSSAVNTNEQYYLIDANAGVPDTRTVKF